MTRDEVVGFGAHHLAADTVGLRRADEAGTVPGVSVPGVSVPGVSVPGVSVPGVSVPGVSVPDLGSSLAVLVNAPGATEPLAQRRTSTWRSGDPT